MPSSLLAVHWYIPLYSEVMFLKTKYDLLFLLSILILPSGELQKINNNVQHEVGCRTFSEIFALFDQSTVADWSTYSDSQVIVTGWPVTITLFKMAAYLRYHERRYLEICVR